MSKLRKFVLVRLAAAGLSIVSVSVLANKEDTSPIEHSPGQVVGRMEEHQAKLHDGLIVQQETAPTARAGKAKSAASKNAHDWSEFLALHVEAEGLSIR
jgi:hypothetical protein